MGIKVEFNPDLTLRAFATEGREQSECLPEKLEQGRAYRFLKKGQRNYWLNGEIPLLQTDGSQLSRPLASIRIIDSTHFLRGNEVWTKGLYEILEVYDTSKPEIHFEGFQKSR